MQKKISKNERTAYHEAGHAVVMHELEMAIREVSIIPNDVEGSLGHVSAYPRPSFNPDTDSSWRTRIKIGTELLVFYAGITAEALFCGRHNRRAANSDLDKAAKLARYITSEENELKAYLGWLKIRTRNLLKNPVVWVKVEAVAQALIERKQLRGKEVKQIIVDRLARAREEGWESLPYPPALLNAQTTSKSCSIQPKRAVFARTTSFSAASSDSAYSKSNT